MRFSAEQYNELPQEKFEKSPVKHQFANPLEKLGGSDCYKIDYSGVVRKSRCLAGMVDIALNIYGL
jgi:hypothetical protein